MGLPPGRTPEFDQYWVVDWSANRSPKTGKDSLWAARLWWDGGTARLHLENYPTRAAFELAALGLLQGELADQRVLLGFDFPLGYPRGFAQALGASASEPAPWRFTWDAITSRLRDTDANASNHFEVAAALNVLATGGAGPFYGVPPRAVPAFEGRLSPRREGVFTFPLRTRCGAELAGRRVADQRGNTASSPWFLYGGSNSVGSQALTGIPVVHRLRQGTRGAQTWPFETGARLPSRAEARVVLCEVYPSRGFVFDEHAPEVKDAQQVRSAACTFAHLDAAGTLAGLFTAPAACPEALVEEGWVLGVPG